MFCKICKQDKIKNPITRGSSTRFINENNKLWNGKTCPDCYKIYNRERMRLKRFQQKKVETSSFEKID